MQITGNTVLITGGSAGIGRALAGAFLQLGNTVIVTGRDEAKLNETRQALPGIHTIRSDVSDPKAIVVLYREITRDFPDLNVIVNNAGIMRKMNLHDQGDDLVDVTREIEINLVGLIQMVKQFLPHLKTRKSAAIVNVSSGLAFIPFPISPIYSATKAGIHSFTQSLRVQLKNTNIKVFELAPPGTDTSLFWGEFDAEDLEGVTPMDLQTLVKHTIAGLEKDTLEIRPGLSNVLKLMSRIAPGFMLKQIGKSADRMLAQTKS